MYNLISCLYVWVFCLCTSVECFAVPSRGQEKAAILRGLEL